MCSPMPSVQKFQLSWADGSLDAVAVHVHHIPHGLRWSGNQHAQCCAFNVPPGAGDGTVATAGLWHRVLKPHKKLPKNCQRVSPSSMCFPKWSPQIDACLVEKCTKKHLGHQSILPSRQLHLSRLLESGELAPPTAFKTTRGLPGTGATAPPRINR